METRSSLYVGKEHVALTLHLYGGTVLDGGVFLFPESGPGVFLWSRLLQFMNDPSPYFPFQARDGGIVLITRCAVMRVTLTTPEANAEDPGVYFVSAAHARFLLTDGSSIDGRVFIDSKPPNTRISDFLCKPDPFFHVVDDRGHEILNKVSVPLVYPLPE